MEDNELYVTGEAPKHNPQVDDTGIVELAAKRKQAAEIKRTAFKKTMRVVYALLACIVAVFVGMFIYQSMLKVAPSTFTVAPTPTPTPNQPAPPDPNKPENWTLYKSDRIKVFIRKPNNATTLETDAAGYKVDVVYDKTKETPTSGNVTDLVEGYIFRVTPLNVGIRDIENITKIKLESFKVFCPTTAVFSEPKRTLVDTIDARSFEIQKCDADYVIYYVPRFGIYYEIAQIYKGDVGYKQKYRATLEEMLRAFKFFPEKEQPIGPFKTFIDERSKIIFTHPNLSETCCDLPKPPADPLNTIVMLGDSATYLDKDNFDGIGVFTTTGYIASEGFDLYMEKQKKLLIEDYKVVKGITPATEAIETKLGKYRAIRLKGYSWRGNELIYADISGMWGTQVAILSIRNISGASFENAINQVLNTFEAY